MIGRDIVSLLQSEARRKPHVAELLARAGSLTDHEIDTADVPLKWFKDALREARNRERQAAQAHAYAEIAAANPLDPNDRGGENAKRGVTLEYTGSDFWAKHSGRTEIEVKTGDWLFFPEDGSGAWLNQTFFPRPPVQLSQSRKVADGTRHDYVNAYKAKLNRHLDYTHGDSRPVDGLANPANQPFRIYRTPGNYY